jgi:hypothetical protein
MSYLCPVDALAVRFEIHILTWTNIGGVTPTEVIKCLSGCDSALEAPFGIVPPGKKNHPITLIPYRQIALTKPGQV